MVIGPRLQAALLERRGGPSPTTPPRCPPCGEWRFSDRSSGCQAESTTESREMAKPQTLRVSCVDDGQMSRPVASTSGNNRLNTAETSAQWVAARPSHAMEHVTPFLTAGLAWTNLPRVPPIVGVSDVVCI
jgi:hypothetical protein